MSDERIPPGKLIGYLREKKSLWFILAALIIGIFLMVGGEVGTCGGTEGRVKAICEEIDGISDVSVMVNSDESGVKGIVIVCAEGDDPAVQLKLTGLLRSLFGISSDQVSIVGGK